MFGYSLVKTKHYEWLKDQYSTLWGRVYQGESDHRIVCREFKRALEDPWNSLDDKDREIARLRQRLDEATQSLDSWIKTAWRWRKDSAKATRKRLISSIKYADLADRTLTKVCNDR